MAAHQYGADITTAQYLRLMIGVCAGTFIEWYDFIVYVELSKTLSALFFSSANPVAQELGYWSVWAGGYLARPIGAVFFGHLGDAYGRRPTLLLSILGMTVPSILVGALPTYAQAGVVAPVLLGLLRLVQGLALGGEYGTAIVYSFELAPDHRKGTAASLVTAASAPGQLLGVLMVTAVQLGCSPAQLELWGWRVPFLLSIFTTPIALLLRLHMPEPREFLQSKEVMTLQRAATLTAQNVAASYVQNSLHAGAATTTSTASARRRAGLDAKQLSLRLESLTDMMQCSNDLRAAVETGDSLIHPAGSTTAKSTTASMGVDAAAALSKVAASSAQALQGGSDPHLSHATLRVRSLAAQPSLHTKKSGQCVAHNSTDLELALDVCKAEYEQQLAKAAVTTKHHIPIKVLLRHHWHLMCTIIMLEAVYGMTFYLFYSWLPAYLRGPAVRLPATQILGPVVLGSVLYFMSLILAGRLVMDGRAPKLWTFLGFCVVVLATVPPALLWVGRGSTAAYWVVLPLFIGVSGWTSVLTKVLALALLPAGVRASGFNILHNFAIAIYGGVTPLIVTALGTRLHPATLSAGVVFLALSSLSLVATPLLLRLAPYVNLCAPISAVLHRAMHK